MESKQIKLLRDVLAFLGTLPATKEVSALQERIKDHLPDPEPEDKPRPICINFNADDFEKRFYRYWKRHMADGQVCAGCGGCNDYGYGGYLDQVCYNCHEAEVAWWNAHHSDPPALPPDIEYAEG